MGHMYLLILVEQTTYIVVDSFLPFRASSFFFIFPLFTLVNTPYKLLYFSYQYPCLIIGWLEVYSLF